jgi:predicted enzyme related to lactoylglutathione lyase
MSLNRVLAVVTVADFETTLAWYERFFGRPADRRPMDGLAEWQVTETGAVQMVRDADRSGSALLTLGVDSLDALTAGLAERGLEVGDITVGVIARVASISDPEGNTITFAEPFSADD